MYSVAGAIDAARRLLDESPARTIAVGNALMSAYIRHGDAPKMLGIFRQMLLERVEPDRVTFLNAFQACSESGTANLLHSFALQQGLMEDVFVASALVEMHCRLGYPENGYRAFELLPLRNSVTWNAMISGFAENGDVRMAFRVFGEMMYGDGIEPDNVTYSSILKACFGAAFAERGKLVHFLLVSSSSCEREQIVCHSLIRMYGGAGSLEDAGRVFESLSEKGVVSCNSMISAYARSGDYSGAVRCFLQMIARGIDPDELTFFGLLSACSHAIRIEAACDHINSMFATHGMRPSAGHLYCLADLVARMGGLKEAEAILHTIPMIEHLDAGCLSLLGHSGTYGHFDQARRFFTWAQGFEVY
jgi:pentatricopeptide repeat protein